MSSDEPGLETFYLLNRAFQRLVLPKRVVQRPILPDRLGHAREARQCCGKRVRQRERRIRGPVQALGYGLYRRQCVHLQIAKRDLLKGGEGDASLQWPLSCDKGDLT